MVHKSFPRSSIKRDPRLFLCIGTPFGAGWAESYFSAATNNAPCRFLSQHILHQYILCARRSRSLFVQYLAIFRAAAATASPGEMLIIIVLSRRCVNSHQAARARRPSFSTRSRQRSDTCWCR